ncbi:MAG: hemerythrin domain-containing protein [Pseudomonadota bacterium]
MPFEQVSRELEKCHQAQTKLCDLLEAIADDLPEDPKDVDRQRCLAAARQVFPTVKKAHDFEEKTLFPLLEDVHGNATELTKSLERLRFEHWEDESFAEEVTEGLIAFGSGDKSLDSDKMGYMLRGFFGGLRRHMAFEVEHLVPMLKPAATLHTVNGGKATAKAAS